MQDELYGWKKSYGNKLIKIHNQINIGEEEFAPWVIGLVK